MGERCGQSGRMNRLFLKFDLFLIICLCFFASGVSSKRKQATPTPTATTPAPTTTTSAPPTTTSAPTTTPQPSTTAAPTTAAPTTTRAPTIPPARPSPPITLPPNLPSGKADPTQALTDFINSERRQRGLGELLNCDILNSVAQQNSNFYSAKGKVVQDASSLLRLRRTGFKFMVATELSSGGQKSPIQVFLAWMKSPKQRKYLLSANTTHIGIGHSPSASESAFWSAILSRPHQGVRCVLSSKNKTKEFKEVRLPSKYVIYASVKDNDMLFRWPQIPNIVEHEMFYSVNGSPFKSFGKVPSTINRCKVKGLTKGYNWKLQMSVRTKKANYLSRIICVTDLQVVPCKSQPTPK